jgi:lipase chaperone LimK
MLALAAIAVGIGIGAVAWLALREPQAKAPELAPLPTAVAPASPAAPAPTGAAATPPPPASLRDSEIDGELIADASGHFVPSRRALALFDYFLSATGEEPQAAIRARIVAEIDRRLADPARHEATALLDRYLDYRADAARTVADERLAESADLERRLQWLRELRRKHFGAELAETLFADDERAIEVGIAQRRVAADASLSQVEKRAQIEALEAQLPESARRARAASSVPLRLVQEEAALHARGGSDAELRALRDSIVGPEAAERLEERDRRRAEWDTRLAAYRAERDAIRADASLDPQARGAAIENVLARSFDAREQTRVRALDEIENQQPSASDE